MEKQDILHWAKKYNAEEDLEFKSLESSMSKKLQKTKKLTKADIEKIIDWKFQGLPGRRKLMRGYIKTEEESKIQEITETALKLKDERSKLSLLTSIKGIGPALASCILSFYDPENYGVFDIHVWREMFGEDLTNFSNTNFLKFLAELRVLAKKYKLPARMVEKALFKKNKEK